MSNSLASILDAPLPMAEKVSMAAKHVLSMPQVDCPVVHKFGENKYIREVSASAGTFAIGHKQKFEHLNVMIKGKVTMLNEDGTTSLLVAPLMYMSPPGRKVGYVHEDMVWQNIYETSETDVEKLEEFYLDKNPEEVALVPKNILPDTSDYIDFMDTLEALGYTAEEVRRQSEITTDLIPFPIGEYRVQVGPSQIEGKGLFATSLIQDGDVICAGRLGGKRTPAGRYTNHSATPNAFVEKNELGDLYLVALRTIDGNKGGGLGEEITIDYLETYLVSRS